MERVVLIGAGLLAKKLVRFLIERGGIQIVAAVDKDPLKIGKDLGEICSLTNLGVTVEKDLNSALKKKKANLAVITTDSDIKTVRKFIEEAACKRLNIVSTCEELSFPWKTNPRIAKSIDNLCKKYGVSCVGTGVNPGFLMDYLPCVLSSVCQKVSRINVTRIQDASKRRIPFQKKIGAGLTQAQFKQKASGGEIRHVGLIESAHMIAHAMNWNLERTRETLKPVVAHKAVASGYVKIKSGDVCGVEQIARGYVGNRIVVQLKFRAVIGENGPGDCIEIKGNPVLKSTIKGGINGDVATCSIIINSIRAITKVTPGLKTMLDIPAPACFSGPVK